MAKVQCDLCNEWFTIKPGSLDGLERERYFLLCQPCQQDYDWADTGPTVKPYDAWSWRD